MSSELRCPAHVPPDRVRPFEWDYAGSIDGLYARLESVQDGSVVVWAQPAGGFGSWMLTREEDIRRALREPTVFSNTLGVEGIPMLIPLMMDAPEHTAYRRLLQPLFAKGAVAALEPAIRRRFRRLLDAVRDQGRCDFVQDIAVRYPTEVFIDWMGLPEADTPGYVALVSSLIHGTREERATAPLNLRERLGAMIDERLADPGEGLLRDIIGLEIDGRPLTRDELLGMTFLLFVAGLDTVVAALSFSMAHLARSEDDRRALVEGTVATERAVEELLRRHSFVSVPRTLATDVVIDGVTLRKGDWVMISTALASRDPEVLDRPYDIDFNREHAHNYAFGLGAHFCLGAHLARLEMRIALDEWHAAIPDYGLDGEPRAWGGFVMGLTHLPLRW